MSEPAFLGTSGAEKQIQDVNVIGTVEPGAKLEVQGAIKASKMVIDSDASSDDLPSRDGDIRLKPQSGAPDSWDPDKEG